jgi:ATP-dependent DNA helicase RecQ
VYRTGQRFGVGYLEKVLLGAPDERVERMGHQQLSVFGIVDQSDAPLLKSVARSLQARGTLVADEHGGLRLAGNAREILRGEASVGVVLAPEREPRSRRRDAESGPVDPLFEALRAKRSELAKEAGVPPYVVFHDSTLREMAAARPQTRDALGRVTGVGTRKLEAYGDAFLAVLTDVTPALPAAQHLR